MKTITTQNNRKYTVSSTIGCTITDSNGSILCNVSPYQQTDFTAISNNVTTDDDSAVISLLFCPTAGNRTGNGEGQAYTCGAANLLRSDHILDLGTLTEPVDISGLSFAESANVQTAELWLTTGNTVTTIIWPTDAIWLAGGEPDLAPDTSYRFAIRREPSGIHIINCAYQYPKEPKN